MGRYFVFCMAYITVVSPALAQVNYYKFSVEARAGLTDYFGDISSYTPVKLTSVAAIHYYMLSNLRTGLEVQSGIISGGDSIRDTHQRYFRNAYKAATILFSYQPWGSERKRLTTWQHLAGGFYVGAGVGLTVNNITRIRRSIVKPGGRTYVFPGKSGSSDLTFPVAAGYSYRLRDRWNYARIGISINYQFAVTSGDGVDGYDDPPSIFRNRSPDMYRVLSLGISYHFGPVGFQW